MADESVGKGDMKDWMANGQEYAKHIHRLIEKMTPAFMAEIDSSVGTDLRVVFVDLLDGKGRPYVQLLAALYDRKFLRKNASLATVDDVTPEMHTKARDLIHKVLHARGYVQELLCELIVATPDGQAANGGMIVNPVAKRNLRIEYILEDE